MSETLTAQAVCTDPTHRSVAGERRGEGLITLLLLVIGTAATVSMAKFTDIDTPLRMALTLGSMMISYPAVSAIVRGRSNP